MQSKDRDLEGKTITKTPITLASVSDQQRNLEAGALRLHQDAPTHCAPKADKCSKIFSLDCIASLLHQDLLGARRGAVLDIDDCNAGR